MNAKILVYKTREQLFKLRSNARITDFFIVVLIFFICTNFINYNDPNYPIYLIVLAFLLFVFYDVLLEAVFRISLGKIIFGLKVIDDKCEKPNVKQAIIRALFSIVELGVITFPIAYFVAQKSPFCQRIGDKVAKTYVIRKKDLLEFEKDLTINSLELEEYIELIKNRKIEAKNNIKNNPQYDNYRFPNNVYLKTKKSSLRVAGIENMTFDEIVYHVNNGGKFAIFYQCISFLILSQKTSSDIYLIKNGENPKDYYRKLNLTTLIFGWWGFPWGIIWSIECLEKNSKGGVDVTSDVMSALASIRNQTFGVTL